jgi:hypothetical protein
MNIKLNKDFVKIHDEAFVYHNFLSSSEIKEIRLKLDSMIDLFKDQHTISIDSFSIYGERLKSLFTEDDIYFQDMTEFQVRFPGDGQKVHIDFVNHMNPLLDMIVDENFTGEKEEILLNPFAFIIYLNEDYEGGEISYPEYNMVYKPKAGDLLVHCVEVPHGVLLVKSGIRYTHSNIIRSKFYVNSNLLKNYIPDDSPYNPMLASHYSYYHQESTNKRMQNLQKTYIEEKKYSL